MYRIRFMYGKSKTQEVCVLKMQRSDGMQAQSSVAEGVDKVDMATMMHAFAFAFETGGYLPSLAGGSGAQYVNAVVDETDGTISVAIDAAPTVDGEPASHHMRLLKTNLSAFTWKETEDKPEKPTGSSEGPKKKIAGLLH